MELNTSQPDHSLIVGKPSRNPILLIVVGALVIGIVAIGMVLWQRMADLDGVRAELASVQQQLTHANSTKTVKPSSKFIAFVSAYNDIEKAPVDKQLSDAEKTAVFDGIKDYYKLTSIPAGAAVLVAYPDEKASGDYPRHAIVYWPASDQKPAGFMDMVQNESGGKWFYNESR